MRCKATSVWAMAVAIILLASAACGSDDSPPADGLSATSVSGGSAAVPSASEDAGGADDSSVSEDVADRAVIELTAVEYAFQGVPETVPAGTELQLFNAGSEMHDLNVFYVGDETAPLQDLVPPQGAHIGVIAALPGQPGVPAVVPGSGPMVVGPLILEQPGRYILYSTMNEGSDPDEWQRFLEANVQAGRDRGVPPPFGNGEPDFMKGMVAELRVVGESAKTVLDVLARDERFETVHDLLVNVAPPHFEGYLSGSRWNLTLLAPTDEAFDALPDGVLAALRADRDLLTRVLDQHVVISYLPSEEFADGEVETVFDRLELTVDGDEIRFGDARVVEADIEAPNGLIHAIDTVLSPAGILEELTS